MAEAVRRSWLLVPPSDEGAVRQAGGGQADVVVLDLVDSVHESAKPNARLEVRDAVALAGRGGAEVFVQIDGELLYADLDAAVWPGLAGVVVSRAESPGDMLEADALLTDLEDRRGLQRGAVQVVASLETAAGNHNAYDIAAASKRVWGMTLGRADLVMNLRPEPSGEIHLMPYLMQRLVTIANAAGVAPLGAWWRSPARGLLARADDTYEAALRGRRAGFKGSLCIADHQVEPLNHGFTPSPQEVEEATHFVDLHRMAEAKGSAAVLVDDRIVDSAAVGQAKRLLAYAEACAARETRLSEAQAASQDEKA